MEFLEVSFEIKMIHLDKIIFDEFNLNKEIIKTSHFYDTEEQMDKEFKEISSFVNFFNSPKTGTITVKELFLGTKIEDFLILLSFNSELGNIDINFSEEDFLVGDNIDKFKSSKLMDYFLPLMQKYQIKSIRFGYEPATDDDTCLIELINDGNRIIKSINRV